MAEQKIWRAYDLSFLFQLPFVFVVVFILFARNSLVGFCSVVVGS